MSQRVLPEIIKDIGFDFDWSEKKVWDLNIPIEEIDIKELEWHFEIPFWNTKNGYYDLKPSSVINYPKKYQKEYDRIMRSDLSYPIDIMKNKGRWLILDGLHRLVKAKILNKTTVEVRKIPRSKISEIKID